MSGELYREDLIGISPVFLLTLAAAGRTWRLASQTVTVLDEDGVAYSFAGRLTDPQATESLGSLGEAASEPSVAFDGLVLDGVLDLIAEGHSLTAGRGELAVWLPGTTLEERRVLVSGRIRSVQPDEGDVVSLTIGDRLDHDRGRLMSPRAVVDAVSCPLAAESAKGARYPVVLGAPGLYTEADGTAATMPGSPALMIDATGSAEVLLICDGWVAATSATIVDTAAGLSESFAVTNGYDLRGRKIAKVSLVGAAVITPDPTKEYYVIWDNGGGLLGDRQEAISGLGDAAVWALRKSSLNIDLQAWAALRQELNRVQIAGFIEQDYAPLPWVMEVLLPLVPVSLRFGPDGLEPVLWQHGQIAADAEVDLDADLLAGVIERDGPLDVDGEVTSEFRLVYAVPADGGNPRRLRVLTGAPLTDPDVSVQGTAQLRSAYLEDLDATGAEEPSVRELQTSWVSDEASAGYILGWQAHLLAFPRSRIGYRSTWALGWLRLGSLALLNQKALRIVDRVAVVDAITWATKGLRFSLRLVHDVARDVFNPA